ncbi:MAG: VacB/RNase II family 3'-5' exoribonuclease [Bryobacteraceae bacterium]|nr:VacB/RNase II family 3'-5' exoribonuclease [Bryobacteraceae bacterium]MDW8378047.1 VacB/RNase II family 3'-5' exoribonuclease [Bryobacterales bacterium]
MTDKELLEHICRLPHSQASFKQLVRELGAKGAAREDLEQALARLRRKGELAETRSGRFVATRFSRDYAAGRLSVHRDGYGFLLADPPVEGLNGDLFLPPSEAQKAMHGDRVLVRIVRSGERGRAEAEIVRILERAHAELVGEFRLTRRGAFVIPHDDRIQQWIRIPQGMELPPEATPAHRLGAAPLEIHSPQDLDGLIVQVEILEYPHAAGEATGRVIEVLGHPDDFGLDVEIMIRKHHIPHRFPPEVLEQARRAPQSVSPEELTTREDFRHLNIVTIDGETARDFDDAVWVDRLPNGNFALQVHIADVSHYVLPGTPIDREALRRGTSVYFPDRAVPMLPIELSAEICSLKPHVDRLVLSVLLEIDRQGDIVAQRFTRGVIRSVERMTYTQVHLLLEGDPAQRERYQPLVPLFEAMKELAGILNRRRMRRGSIDFDLPEPLIEFDEFGEMVGLRRAPRNIAHRIIEEFMLAANEAVATHLENLGWPSIYRIHEPPDAKRVADFELLAAHFGYSLGVGPVAVRRYPHVDRHRDGRKVRKDLLLEERVAVSSRHYQKLIQKLEGKPEERILNYLMLRSLKQARYSENNCGHFALAAPCYTHFTSPIRRYPDLVVHRILSRWLDGAEAPFSAADLKEIAEDNSFTERRAAEAERELVEWKKLKFMADRVGQEFPALIIQTAKYGFFVELENLFVEGLVPIETLPQDRFRYRESTREIIGERSKRVFRIGDRVRVCLDRVHAVEKKLQFSLVEDNPTKRRRKLPRSS